jgi:hypothetical protein
MHTKVNCSSWNKLEFMDNVINTTFIIVNTKRGGGGGGDCIICKQWINSKVQERPILSLEVGLIFWPMQSHCKPWNGLSSHSQSQHKTSDLKILSLPEAKTNFFLWYWLWWPWTKHGHHTFCPCLASTMRMDYKGILNKMSLWNVVGKKKIICNVTLS